MTTFEIVYSSILGAGFIGFVIREVAKNRINKHLQDEDKKKEQIKLNAKKLEEEELMNKIDTRIEEHVVPKLDNLTATLEEFIEDNKKHQVIIDSALMSVLKDRLHELYRICNERGYTGEYERINFNTMFENYTALGGNNEMHDVREKFLDLPLKKPRKSRNTNKKILVEGK